ncbi:LytR/AlgR family response regulator transcription factor, partial [Mesonia oceanica]
RYTEFYLTDGTTLVSCKNIGDYEKLLPSNVFFRIHKTYIVNLNTITEIDKKQGHVCKLKNGQSLPISKRKYLELVKFLNMN